MGVFPSGQWGQTVNLLLFSFGGSNPPAPTKNSSLVKMLEFLFCRNFSKHIQGWIRTAATRRIVRRGKRPLRGLFRCAACESTRAHEKTAGVEIHWRFSFAQMSDSHRRVDENSGGADCNDDERRQRRKQRGVVGAAASDTQARRSGCWVPQPVRLRRKQGGEAGAALRFFKAPPRGCRKIGKRNS